MTGGQISIGALFGAGLVVLAGCGDSHDHSKHGHDKSAPAPAPTEGAQAKPYPLKTCVVSGEELGKMGEEKRIVFEGQEIKFCCPSCEKDFRKDPKKYLKMIEEARK
jgi:YHS domain-containing protein